MELPVTIRGGPEHGCDNLRVVLLMALSLVVGIVIGTIPMCCIGLAWAQHEPTAKAAKHEGQKQDQPKLSAQHPDVRSKIPEDGMLTVPELREELGNRGL